MIEIKNLHKSFGKNEIVRGVDVQVNKGDVVVILGPSGSGKTTFLRCLNFLERAEEGEITIDDVSVKFKQASKKDIFNIRKKIGFVFQNHNLFANKTAIENVMEGLITARKMSKKQSEEIALEALKKVGMEEKRDSYPCQLSGGQQQRVGIARAVALNPEVILFDEPTSALDPELVGETLRLIKSIAKEGITMIVVTHEISFAQDVANQVIFMADGVVVEKGEPNTFFLNPKEERTKTFLQRILPEEPMYNL